MLLLGREGRAEMQGWECKQCGRGDLYAFSRRALWKEPGSFFVLYLTV